MNCNICTPGAEGTYTCDRCIRLMKKLLRQVAYPRRGTREEAWTIQDAADEIQRSFELCQLEED
jgi:hypothetical protein